MCIFVTEWVLWSSWGLIALLQGTINCTQQQRRAFFHFPNTQISAGITTGKLPATSHNFSLLSSSCNSHTEFTVDLITLQCVFSGSRSIPGSDYRCFQGHWLLGNKSAEIPNLNGALHSITGRSNCNRKAIITYSSSSRERLFAQPFLASAADYDQLQFTHIYPSTFIFPLILRGKVRE